MCVCGCIQDWSAGRHIKCEVVPSSCLQERYGSCNILTHPLLPAMQANGHVLRAFYYKDV